jgi:flagellar assembly protein FliH
MESLPMKQVILRENAAFARGAMEGERRLSQQLIEQRTQLMDLQNGVLTSLQAAAADVMRQSEQGMVQLALTIAEKLVGSIPISPELVAGSVRSALADAGEATEFQIQLHPDDIALLKETGSPLFEPEPGMTFHLESSPAIARGGCMVLTKFGIIDARRETRLSRIAEALAP